MTIPADPHPPSQPSLAPARPQVHSGVRRIVASAGAVSLLVLVTFLTWPSPIDAAAWNAPDSPSFARGVWAQNNALAGAEPVTTVPRYPEWVTFDRQGNLYTGDVDGKIYRVTFADGRPAHTDLYADTGGAP